MKKMLAVLVFAFAATGASAQGMSCVLVSRLAHEIMDARQKGVAMVDAMKIAEESGSIRGVVVPLTKAAYSTPRFMSDQMQMRAIENFRDEAAAICYRKQS